MLVIVFLLDIAFAIVSRWRGWDERIAIAITASSAATAVLCFLMDWAGEALGFWTVVY